MHADAASRSLLKCSATLWPRNWPWRRPRHDGKRETKINWQMDKERARIRDDGSAGERKNARAERRESERERRRARALNPRCGTKDKILKISAQKSPRHGATDLMAVRHAKSFRATRYRLSLFADSHLNGERTGSWLTFSNKYRCPFYALGKKTRPLHTHIFLSFYSQIILKF